MISIFLCGLMLTSALAVPAPDKNFNSAAVVRAGRQGRQLLTGFRNGQALANGAVVRRKVLRRGRGNAVPLVTPASTTPLLLTRNVAAPAAPALIHHHHAAPIASVAGPVVAARAPVIGPAPAPIFTVRTPIVAAPAPAIRVHSHAAGPALAPAFVPPPQLVAQVAAPVPAPAPIPVVAAPVPAPAPLIEEPAVIAVGRDTVAAPTLEYGAPSTVAPEVRAPVEGYGAPVEVVEVRQGYLAAEADEEIPEVVEVRDSYLAAEPATEAPAVIEVKDIYGSPAEEVVEIRSDYLASAAEERAQPAYTVPRTVANVKSNTVKSKPIAIVRSQYNPPAATSVFDYSFESENGIKQEAVGTMRLVDDSEVSVMKGSYSYIGADGASYQVDWYADETGFHASAPHLPKPVEPNHPEVAAAVRAQIAFAAEEDAARSAGNLSSYGAADDLASYN